MGAAALSDYDRWKLDSGYIDDREPPECAQCDDAGCPECSDAAAFTEDDIMAELADMLAVLEVMDDVERAMDRLALHALADLRAGVAAAEAVP